MSEVCAIKANVGDLIISEQLQALEANMSKYEQIIANISKYWHHEHIRANVSKLNKDEPIRDT